ncbi:MAG: 2TM domain-containing protein [Proteobacteria bacterium]|nr:2TM domain-containing protein [Pseudomonadota bacterium]
MNTTMSQDEIDRLAHKRAGAKLGWYLHAAVYAAVNLLLFFIAGAAGRGHWNLFPALGWGLGLALHWASVFVFGPGSTVRARLVQSERERLQRGQSGT